MPGAEDPALFACHRLAFGARELRGQLEERGVDLGKDQGGTAGSKGQTTRRGPNSARSAARRGRPVSTCEPTAPVVQSFQTAWARGTARSTIRRSANPSAP